MDAAGNLYGTTSQDGAGGDGDRFRADTRQRQLDNCNALQLPKTSSGTENCFGQNGNLLLDDCRQPLRNDLLEWSLRLWRGFSS